VRFVCERESKRNNAVGGKYSHMPYIFSPSLCVQQLCCCCSALLSIIFTCSSKLFPLLVDKEDDRYLQPSLVVSTITSLPLALSCCCSPLSRFLRVAFENSANPRIIARSAPSVREAKEENTHDSKGCR
jgi:hypothetical protein